MLDDLIKQIDQLNEDLLKTGQSIQVELQAFSSEMFVIKFAQEVVFNAASGEKLDFDDVRKKVLKKSKNILDRYYAQRN